MYRRSADRILREAGLGRAALEGELAALEAAWREAEEIASIADSLPGVAALNRMFDRLRG